MSDNDEATETWLKNALLPVVQEELHNAEARPSCEHNWVSQHMPGHLLYWVKICGLCMEPDWDDLDREIRKIIREAKGDRMDSATAFQDKARLLVMMHYNRRKEITDDYEMTIDDVFVVWFSKTLQNWKALVSTTVSDGMYYEVTYDGDKETAYLDAYKKFENVAYPDDS